MTHAHAHAMFDQNPERGPDPTGTRIIRRSLRMELERRWIALRRVLQGAIVGQDLFGLSAVSPHSIGFISRGGDRLSSFQIWFDQALLTTVVGEHHDWLRQWIERGYGMGSRRAVHDVDVIDVLTKATHVELQGIAEAVSQQVVRVLSTALTEKRRAPAVFRSMGDRVRRVGSTRTRGLSNFAVVRAHATGTLDRLQAHGVRRVGVIPETVSTLRATDAKLKPSDLVRLQTAEDNKVCPRCEEIEEDGPYTIREARKLIPAHPNCRCAFVPWEGR